MERDTLGSGHGETSGSRLESSAVPETVEGSILLPFSCGLRMSHHVAAASRSPRRALRARPLCSASVQQELPALITISYQAHIGCPGTPQLPSFCNSPFPALPSPAPPSWPLLPLVHVTAVQINRELTWCQILFPVAIVTDVWICSAPCHQCQFDFAN